MLGMEWAPAVVAQWMLRHPNQSSARRVSRDVLVVQGHMMLSRRWIGWDAWKIPPRSDERRMKEVQCTNKLGQLPLSQLQQLSPQLDKLLQHDCRVQCHCLVYQHNCLPQCCHLLRHRLL
ncbi:hypothetical protein HPB47_014582 [Ixodes persulcatus]|uniref:Uncharacterized protein n=1 Tax=Ixodes persulcatus TaxID=34615 RepID=A0AC60QVQ2_IXOPE|nr:hypothetical protein HPB47_014582 [Ixodes persulcatus]